MEVNYQNCVIKVDCEVWHAIKEIAYASYLYKEKILRFILKEW
jgi:hypothetical protein